jgi:osmotically-inducible protein OsmY
MKSDTLLKRDVLDELNWNAEIDETKIGVIANNGAVTLTGHGRSWSVFSHSRVALFQA